MLNFSTDSAEDLGYIYLSVDKDGTCCCHMQKPEYVYGSWQFGCLWIHVQCPEWAEAEKLYDVRTKQELQ